MLIFLHALLQFGIPREVVNLSILVTVLNRLFSAEIFLTNNVDFHNVPCFYNRKETAMREINVDPELFFKIIKELTYVSFDDFIFIC